MGMTVFEKVILLQDVDIFESLSAENLSHLAHITQEIDVQKNQIIFREGDASNSMYIIVQGRVVLHQDDVEVLTAEDRAPFGTWALLDDQPRVVTATAAEDSSLLMIDKEDFYDLLSDHIQITQSIIQGITGRLRQLMQRVGG